MAQTNKPAKQKRPSLTVIGGRRDEPERIAVSDSELRDLETFLVIAEMNAQVILQAVREIRARVAVPQTPDGRKGR